MRVRTVSRDASGNASSAKITALGFRTSGPDREPGDGIAQPPNYAIVGKHDCGVDRLMEARRAGLQFQSQRVAPGRVAHRARSAVILGAHDLKALNGGKVMARLWLGGGRIVLFGAGATSIIASP